MTTDDLLRTAMTVDDELDEIRRARAWARLEPQLAAPMSRPRAHRSIAIGFALAAAAAAIIVVVHGHTTPASYVAPRDTTLSLHVDDHTRAVLVGPAQLDPIEQSATTTVVRLRSGTLLAEFEGGHGRSLRILAPGAVVEIVGTLFAVEARHDATCVSVSHGTVRMTSAGRVQTITTGERACSDELAMQPIEAAVRDALARHGRRRSPRRLSRSSRRCRRNRRPPSYPRRPRFRSRSRNHRGTSRTVRRPNKHTPPTSSRRSPIASCRHPRPRRFRFRFRLRFRLPLRLPLRLQLRLRLRLRLGLLFRLRSRGRPSMPTHCTPMPNASSARETWPPPTATSHASSPSFRRRA